jgi:hypothetical protein
MNTWTKVLRYEMRNVLRARALLGYGLFFLAATTGLVRMGVEWSACSPRYPT